MVPSQHSGRQGPEPAVWTMYSHLPAQPVSVSGCADWAPVEMHHATGVRPPQTMAPSPGPAQRPSSARCPAYNIARPSTMPNNAMQHASSPDSSAASPAAAAPGPGPNLSRLRSGIIGHGTRFQTPFGERVLVQVDRASSGRALQPVEEYLSTAVYPWIGNASGHNAGPSVKVSKGYLRDARESIAGFLGAPRDEYAIIFAGNGLPTAVGKLAQLLGLRHAAAAGAGAAVHRPVVIHSTAEERSTSVVWQDIDCEHLVIPMNAAGTPDMVMLEAMLMQHAASSLIVGTFSLACPVTGAVADYRALTRLLHKHGAVAVVEYSGCGASLPLSCTNSSGSGLRSPCAAEQPDAIVMSPSSLPGGAGAAAVLVIRRSVIQVAVPQGRDTSSADSFDSFSGLVDTFIADIEHHEGADPANLLGVVRAGLAVQLHSDMAPPIMHSITEEYTQRAIAAWRMIPGVQLLGADQPGPRLPVISFNLLVQRFPLMASGRGGQPAVGMPMLLHHRFVANALSDVYGIQADVGCVSEWQDGIGYVHGVLLSVEETLVDAFGNPHEALEATVAKGMGWARPGWVQVHFSHLMSSQEVDFVIRAVAEMARDGWKLLPQYDASVSGGHFSHFSERSRLRPPNSMVRASQQILHAPQQNCCETPTSRRPQCMPASTATAATPTGTPAATPTVKPAEDLALDSWGAASLMARSVDSTAAPPHTHASSASSGSRSKASTKATHRKKQPIMKRLTSLLKPSSKRRDPAETAQAAGASGRTDSREGEGPWDSGSNSNMSAETTPLRARHSGAVSPMQDRVSTPTSAAASAAALQPEPRVALEDPERFVLRGGSADMAWERDMYVQGSAYSQWANCGVRWFLLQHEAAAALRLGMKLAL